MPSESEGRRSKGNLDQNGNAKGGIRPPNFDIPTAQYVAGPAYPLEGFTIAFAPAKLKELYPTHEIYVEKIRQSADAAVKAGFLLPQGADEYVKLAEIAPVPEPIPTEAKLFLG
ncbi:alpha/beta hydrolase domain-containing protein [Treponema primitia]|uniref:alpha/beta hydrolase domain-containing protein n=1 Tax=Treponema primitia TaxID=88058 RepID=UPI003CCB6388